VDGSDTVEVRLADDRKFDAEWVRTDPQTDLAVVKIQAEGLVEAPLGNSEKMEVGDWVLAIGSPRGLPQTVTAGIISATGRVTGRPNSYENYLQTDASINRGNSGGPLVNMRGELIGINNSILSFSGGNEGIGFAVPSNMASRIMAQLIEKGKVTRGFLGVVIQNVDEGLAKSFDLPHTNGALVAQVKEDSPADRAGIEEGDFIVQVDGKDIEDVNQLRNAVAAIKPGETVSLGVLRDGEPKTVEVRIQAQPEDMAAAFGQGSPQAQAQIERFGMEVTTLTPELAEEHGYAPETKGALITEVAPGSDAAEQQLRPPMVITRINRRKIADAEGVATAMAAKEAASGVRLRVLMPGGGSRFVFITPKS
jgi:serine protease Do